jgi:(p)ppGpp synthase/HD superfamily hydrolase
MSIGEEPLPQKFTDLLRRLAQREQRRSLRMLLRPFNEDEDAGSLKHAIEIASAAHHGQVNKANEPYILHPMRVMDQVESTDEKITAILHDVVEKNPEWYLDRLLNEGFNPKVIKAVDAMTRRREESYDDFVLRAAANPTSRAVKLADLKDDIHMAHMAGLDDSRYRSALEIIGRRRSR